MLIDVKMAPQLLKVLLCIAIETLSHYFLWCCPVFGQGFVEIVTGHLQIKGMPSSQFLYQCFVFLRERYPSPFKRNLSQGLGRIHFQQPQVYLRKDIIKGRGPPMSSN